MPKRRAFHPALLRMISPKAFARSSKSGPRDLASPWQSKTPDGHSQKRRRFDLIAEGEPDLVGVDAESVRCCHVTSPMRAPIAAWIDGVSRALVDALRKRDAEVLYLAYFDRLTELHYQPKVSMNGQVIGLDCRNGAPVGYDRRRRRC